MRGDVMRFPVVVHDDMNGIARIIAESNVCREVPWDMIRDDVDNVAEQAHDSSPCERLFYIGRYAECGREQKGRLTCRVQQLIPTGRHDTDLVSCNILLVGFPYFRYGCLSSWDPTA